MSKENLDINLNSVDIDAETAKENRAAGVVLNEKQLAKYLGTSRYFVTLLRKKYGLKYVVLRGMHNIYYYLPMVDEFFRNMSKSDNSDEDSDESSPESASEVKLPEAFETLVSAEPKRVKTMHFKPMQQI